MMKSAILRRTLLGCTAFLFVFLTCHGQDESSAQLAGTFTKNLDGRTATFTISSDLSYQVEFVGDSEVDVYGTYEISGNRVTFNDEGGAYAAKDVPGAYEYQLDEGSVTFKAADDPLAGRRVLLEGEWSKAEMP